MITIAFPSLKEMSGTFVECKEALLEVAQHLKWYMDWAIEIDLLPDNKYVRRVGHDSASVGPIMFTSQEEPKMFTILTDEELREFIEELPNIAKGLAEMLNIWIKDLREAKKKLNRIKEAMRNDGKS